MEFQVSYTKLATFRRCRQQYYWKYIRKYFPQPALAMVRGSSGHAALAEWHKDYEPTKAIEAAWRVWYAAGYSDNEHWQLLQRCLGNYFQWSLQNDKFVMKESEFKFTLQFENGDTPITLIGYVDGILEDSGRYWLLENKFQQRASIANLDMDAQVTLYLMAMSALRNDIEGVLYNVIRVGDTKIAQKEPCLRSKLYRSQQGYDRVAQETVSQAQEMIQFETQGLQPYRNPSKNCSWDCAFYSVCLSMMDDGQESEQLLEAACRNQNNSLEEGE